MTAIGNGIKGAAAAGGIAAADAVMRVKVPARVWRRAQQLALAAAAYLAKSAGGSATMSKYQANQREGKAKLSAKNSRRSAWRGGCCMAKIKRRQQLKASKINVKAAMAGNRAADYVGRK